MVEKDLEKIEEVKQEKANLEKVRQEEVDVIIENNKLLEIVKICLKFNCVHLILSVKCNLGIFLSIYIYNVAKY